jgi:hypothetical protein
MSPEPAHFLFIQWGKFKAGAFGLPAIVFLTLLVALFACLLLR